MTVDIVRDAAVDVLLRVFEREVFLSVALDKTLRRRNLSDRGRRFLTQLAYGTVRHKTLCDHVLSNLVRQPLEKLPAPILTILRMGVFQALFCNQVTFPAMVHTSVDLAKKRGHAGTARLVNAVLKRVPKRLEDVDLPNLTAVPVEALRIRYSLPPWFVEAWIAERGMEAAQALCAACSEQAPLTIRANTMKTSTEELRAGLEKAGCRVEKTTPVPEELTILEGSPLRTKLFQRGHFMLQDPASMLAAHLVEPRAGERILDLCAAPGGKTTHLAQLAGGHAEIVACDVSPHRLHQVRDNVERLETPAVRLICGDGLAPPFAERFAAVLVDAPCTGLGTLRRHPDLKWRTRQGDAARLGALQRDLLRSAARLCDNDGRIVFSVCTLTPEETTAVAHYAESLKHLKLEDGPEWLNRWRIGRGMYETLPNAGAMDGFFLMRLRKSS